MRRGFQLLLLLVQIYQEGFRNIPAVSVAVLGFNVYLHMLPAATPTEACVNLQQVFRYKEYRRLFLSPLHHIDDLHLHCNMALFLWIGVQLERRLGGGWFLYMLSVFSVLTGLVYLLLQALIQNLSLDSTALAGLIDLTYHSNECAVGFSGVLFALKVVNNHFNPGGVTYVMNIRVSNHIDSWVELVLIYLITSGTSLVGHLAGVLVGLLYTLGPLKVIMETCADLVSADEVTPHLSSYSSSSGEMINSEDPQPEEDLTSDYTESDLAGLTEEQQVELAIRLSLRLRGQTLQKETGGHSEDEEVDRKEARVKRQTKSEQQVTNQRRRKLQ